VGGTRRHVEGLESRMSSVTEELEQELVVKEAYQGDESVLDGVADGLRRVMGESIIDVQGLFDKLRKFYILLQDIASHIFFIRAKDIWNTKAARLHPHQTLRS
jgi:hypothetical protein